MSKKRSVKGNDDERTERRTKSGGLASVRWFNPSPNDGDRLWLKDNDDKLIELALSVFDAIEQDGRYTAKYDVKSTRWLAILFVPSSSTEYDLDALSVRGSTPFDALILLGYFHFIKFEEAWVPDDAESDGRWG